jgi:Xaa-Pro aminopeptidase
MTYRKRGEEVWADTWGTVVSDAEEGINVERLRNDRVARCREQLEVRGLGAVLVFSDPNVNYITGKSEPYSAGSGMLCALLIKDAPKPILFERGDKAIQLRMRMPWVEVEPYYRCVGAIRLIIGDAATDAQMKKFVSVLKGVLKKHDALGVTIGMDISEPYLEAALKAESIKVVPGGMKALLDAREIKTPMEVECIRIAHAISEAIFANIKQAVRPGIDEKEIRGIMADTCFKLGGYFVVPGCMSGPATAPLFKQVVPSRMLRPLDILVIDTFGVHFMGYTTCCYRTFSVGEPRKETKEAYKRVYKWLYDSIEACYPGKTTKDVAEKWPAASRWGRIDEEGAFGNNYGHGVGLTQYEAPVIYRGVSLEYPYPIKAGQVFALETWDADGLGQGVRLEEVIHVHEDGPEVMTRWPAEEIIVCPL